MANIAKPAFDHKAHQLALAQFTEQLEEHVWSFQADSYYELMASQAAEVELFKQAQLLGIQGVDEFNYHRNQVIQQMKDASFDRGMAKQKENMEHSIDYYKKQLDEVRAKYMKPIDFFKEKLDKHDWYYEFSDDITVYRRGKAAQVALQDEAKDGGPEFEAAFAEKRQSVIDNIRKS